MDPALTTSIEVKDVYDNRPFTPTSTSHHNDHTPTSFCISHSPSHPTFKGKLRSTFQTIRSAIKSPLRAFKMGSTPPLSDENGSPKARGHRSSVKQLFAATLSRYSYMENPMRNVFEIERSHSTSVFKRSKYKCPEKSPNDCNVSGANLMEQVNPFHQFPSNQSEGRALVICSVPHLKRGGIALSTPPPSTKRTCFTS